MDEMAAARFNTLWFLSLLAPAAIMFFVTFWNRRTTFFAGAVFSLVVTYMLCNLSVKEKWDTRCEIAKTDQELQYATADGANLVFTAYFIGPFEAVLYTWFWGYVGRKCWGGTPNKGGTGLLSDHPLP